MATGTRAATQQKSEKQLAVILQRFDLQKEEYDESSEKQEETSSRDTLNYNSISKLRVQMSYSSKVTSLKGNEPAISE